MSCLTLCMLAQTRKLSQFKNFAYNSFGKLGGKVLGASKDGLCIIGDADKDNTTGIASEITFASTDFGVRNPKKIRRLYFGFYSEGPLTLTVSADKQASKVYTLPVDSEGQGRGFITINQDQRGKYWTLKIENSAGGYFAIDSIDVLLIPFSEGRHT